MLPQLCWSALRGEGPSTQESETAKVKCSSRLASAAFIPLAFDHLDSVLVITVLELFWFVYSLLSIGNVQSYQSFTCSCNKSEILSMCSLRAKSFLQ